MRRILTSIVLLVLAPTVQAGPAGTLDPSFGAAGQVVTDLPGSYSAPDLARALALQPDGKIVVVGSGPVPAVARYLTDGRLDPSFGPSSTGLVNGGGVAVAIQADGKIVTGQDLTRYNADGTLDTTFGSAGTGHAANQPVDAGAIAIQPDGRLVVGGSTGSPPGVFGVARYLADGTLDPSFGTGSVVTTSAAQGSVLKVLVLGDGRIVAAGGGGAFRIARYLADGTLDATFGSGGVVALQPSLGFPATDALELPGGQLLLTGDKGTLVRLDPDGSLDATFGSGGVLSDGRLVTGALVRQPDGKIVVAGGGPGPGGLTFAIILLRYLPDGTPDPGFGTGGFAETDAGGTSLIPPAGLVLQPDGRLVVANGAGFGLARFFGGTCGDGTLDAGEDCDDGNLVAGDGCDASCCTADADGDGVCDAIDPCTGVPVPVTKPKIAVRFGSRTGAVQSFALSGLVTLPHPFSPALDPATKGVRLIVSDASGASIDVAIPGTAFLQPPAAWTMPIAGKWKYTDKTLLRPGNLDAAVIQDQSTSVPGRVKFTIKGKSGRFGVHGGPVPGTTLPLSAVVVFDAPTATGGQCGGLTFPGPPGPTCFFPGTSGTKLTCH